MSSTFVRIGRFVLDVSLSENHTFESEVTDYPVESGGSVSDNIRPKPFKVSIEGVVSDTPLLSNATNRPITLHDPYAPDAVSWVVGLIYDAADMVNDIRYLRSAEAFAFLEQLWESRQTVVVRTSMGTYPNMAMTSLNVPRSKETTGGLKFTAEFQQIQMVTNKRSRKRTSVRNGKGKKDRGSKPTKDTGLSPSVEWRQGNPPGSMNIEASVFVQYVTLKPIGVTSAIVSTLSGSRLSLPALPIQQAWQFTSGPRAYRGESNDVSNAASLAFGTRIPTKYENSFLTPAEVRALDLDLRRDRNLREGRVLTSTSTRKPISARTPTTDIADSNRRWIAAHQPRDWGSDLTKAVTPKPGNF